MNPEAQRIAIAEACGARIISKAFTYGSGKGFKWAWAGNKKTPCSFPGGGFYGFGWNEEASVSELPDYLNDLNAMHEAEELLTCDQAWEYSKALDCILGTAAGIGSGVVKEWKWYATAPQRAEAFLRTLGLWAEEKL